MIVRIRRGDGSPQSSRAGTRVVGSIEGVAHNTSSPVPNDDIGRTVSFGAPGANASLEGVLALSGPVVDGTVIGGATLAANGTSVSCNSGTVQWSMSLRQ